MPTQSTATEGEAQSGIGKTADWTPRPRELQDALNFHLYHPLAWRLARRLEHTPVTPNMVSVTGGCFVVAAAVAYAQPGWPLPAILGMLLHMAWHVVDGADGDLARLTGRSSPTGELVDGICDYASHLVLYVVLAYLLHMQIGPLAWALASASGLSRMIQSNHFEAQRRQYQWRVYGIPWLRNAQNDGHVGKGGFAALGSIYLKAASRLAPQEPGIEVALAGVCVQGSHPIAPPGSWEMLSFRRRRAPPRALRQATIRSERGLAHTSMGRRLEPPEIRVTPAPARRERAKLF